MTFERCQCLKFLKTERVECASIHMPFNVTLFSSLTLSFSSLKFAFPPDPSMEYEG